MKKLFGLIVIMVALSFMATNAEAITARAYSIGVGYSQAEFVVDIDSATTDSGAQSVILYVGTSIASMAGLDTLVAITYPDTLDGAVVGTFEEGVTYYWYLAVTDSLSTIYVPFDYQTAPHSFTTTSLTHTNSVVSDGYSTAWIEVTYDTTGVGDIIDSIRLDLDKTVGTTYSDSSITSVTYPDTVKYSGLDEGVTYSYRTVVFLTDSTVADTTAVGTFTTTDLTVGITQMALAFDSIGVIVDSNAILVDSMQFHYGASSVTVNSVSLTTVTGVDTFYVLNMPPGATFYYEVLAYLPDSAVTETTITYTYNRPSKKFLSQNVNWGDKDRWIYNWDFDNHTDTYSSGIIPIDFSFLRVHVTLDGYDDFATSDSINVFLWTYIFGDSIAMDTVVTLAPDTVTTILSYTMEPAPLADTSAALFPWYNWGTHYGISASMSNDDGQADSATTLGNRGVHIILEEIE